jgi:hypothetical protein
MPSIHSSVSTRRAVRRQSTAGTRKLPSSGLVSRAIFSAISEMAAASSRMSISISTWAMEAAATGGPNSAKWSSSRPPSSASMVRRASFMENGGSRSWRWRRSSASFGPIRSARVARNCPSLM